MIKKLVIAFSSLILTATSSLAGDLVNVSGASGIAVNGYDTVAFFTEKKPVHGNPSISVKHSGATYLFSSKENAAKFEANPTKYAPQTGGFCTYGVSVGALFPVDISTWQVRDGKLYLNLNPEILKAFNGDFAGNVKKAEGNWGGLEKKHGK